MMNFTVFKIEAEVNPDSTVTLKGCLEDPEGTGASQPSGMKLVKQADLASISLKVFDADAPATITFGPSNLTIANVIYNTLQTDWAKDTRGYNFKYRLPTTAVPNGNKRYTAKATFTTTGGGVSFMEWDLKTRKET